MSQHILLLGGEEHKREEPPHAKLKPYPALLFGLGLLLLALGTLLPPRLAQLVEDAVWEQTRVDSFDSANMPAFVNGSAGDADADELLLKFYFFHVTNANNPFATRYRVEERGPYVYRVELKRQNLSFVDLESPRRELYFKTWQQVFRAKPQREGEEVWRDDSELITTVSMPFQFLNALTHNARPDLPLFVTKSVREHLFGYEQELVSRIPIRFPGFVTNYSSPIQVDRNTRVDAQRVDYFSPARFTYQNYQGQSILKKCATCTDTLWRTMRANRVQGGDGKFWGKSTRAVFIPALNRHVLVDRNTSQHLVDGIRVCDVTLNTSSLFDVKREYNEEHKLGVFNLTRAYLGVPLFASKPRFLDGEEDLVQGVDGLQRGSRDAHDTVFHVHKETRLAIKVLIRLQYSILLPPHRHHHGTLRQRTYLPMFWFETEEEMSKKHRELFKRCDTIVDWADFASSVLKYLGIALIVCGSVVTTNRQETDAIRMQRSVAIIAARERQEEEGEEEPERGGIRMIWSSPSLRNGWLSTPPFVFTINSVIGMLALQKSKHMGIWRPYENDSGPTSTAVFELLLTALIVSLTVCVNAVQVARAAFIDGEVPQHCVRYSGFDRPHRCCCCVLPFLPTGDACKLGLSVGMFSLALVGLPTLLGIALLVCHDGSCAWDWWMYIVFKSTYAALLSAIVYPFAALRALHQEIT